MRLQKSYSFIAPFYDKIVGRGSQNLRKSSLESIAPLNTKKILFTGIGTGLDIPYLPLGGEYYGVDITRAMLHKAIAKTSDRDDIELYQGDVMALPHAGETFDAVVMHLILAVAPEPVRTLQEASRVLRTGGRITIVDKFLRPGQRAPLRQLINPLLKRVATQTNIVFESLISQCPELHIVEDESMGAGGWFRRILLGKKASDVQ